MTSPIAIANPLERKSSSSGPAFGGLVTVGVLIAGLVALTPFAFQWYGDNAYIGMALIAGVLTCLAAALAGRIEDRRALIFILCLGVAFRGYALLFEPFLSSDVYRYIWDGTVQGAGINPYRFVPADPALAHLRDAAIYPNINRADYAVTIYPPVAQFFFFLVTRFGASTLVMRFALLGCEAMSVALMLLLLRRTTRPLTSIVAYAWHPLPIWEIANGGHVDALMVTLMLFGLWLSATERSLSGAMLIALASLVKGLAAPTLAAVWRPWNWKIPLGVIIMVAICYLPYISVGWGVLGFLPNGYVREEGLVSGSNFWLLSIWRLVFGEGRFDVACYLVVAAAILSAIALRAAFRRVRTVRSTLLDAETLLLAALLLLSPSYPWYFLIIVPFTAILGNAPAWAASIGALVLTNETETIAHMPALLAKSILFGGVLLCWTLAIGFGRLRQSTVEAVT